MIEMAGSTVRKAMRYVDEVSYSSHGQVIFMWFFDRNVAQWTRKVLGTSRINPHRITASLYFTVTDVKVLDRLRLLPFNSATKKQLRQRSEGPNGLAFRCYLNHSDPTIWPDRRFRHKARRRTKLEVLGQKRGGCLNCILLGTLYPLPSSRKDSAGIRSLCFSFTMWAAFSSFCSFSAWNIEMRHCR